MRPVRWMLPTCGPTSKAVSPRSRPWVSGSRAGWSRPCRYRRAGTYRAAPAEAEIQRSSRPRTRTSPGRLFAFQLDTQEGPRAPDPATWPRGRRATWHRAHGHSAVGTPFRTRTPADGEWGQLDSGQHQAAAGPVLRERPAAAAATTDGDVGVPALRLIRKAMSGRPDARLLTGSWLRP